MSSPQELNLPGKISDPSNGVAVKHSRGFIFPKSETNSIPLLSLPPDFNSYQWKGVIEAAGGKSVPVPEIDKILTAYSNNCLRTWFTAEFVEFVDEQFPLFDFPKENNKLSYAVNLYLTICNFLPIVYGAEAQKVLSFYLGNAFQTSSPLISPGGFSNSTNIMNVGKLNLSRLLIEKTAVSELTRTVFHFEKINFQINEQRARELITAVNTEIEKDVDVYFVNSRARAREILPDDVKNDERFIASMHDASWNEYDETIKKEVAYYNRKFSGVNGFTPLDWRYVKAMLWTEILAGPKGNPEQWTTFPMQIGRFVEDKGYVAVRDGKPDEGADLVTSEELRDAVKDKSKMVGHLNVRAGIAYLYIRAIGAVKTEDVVVPPILTTTVIKGEGGFDAIAKRLQTMTASNIRINNPGVDSKKLQPGQEIKYQQAKPRRSVLGWKDWLTAIQIYNQGDPKYIPKVQRAYRIITSRTPK